MKSNCLCKLFLIVFFTLGLSSSLKAEENSSKVKKSETQEETTIDPKSKDKDQDKDKDQNKNDDNKKKEAKQPFVDRDGDGIRDGQEHRFRGKHRRGRHRHGKSGQSGQRERTMHRQGGAQKGPQ
jgi:hypothetical protein